MVLENTKYIWSCLKALLDKTGFFEIALKQYVTVIHKGRIKIMYGKQINPLVSVIIPAYNSEETIEAAIYSAVIQGIDVELVIINDASLDHTADIIQNCQEKYDSDHIKWNIIDSRENLGAAASRNLGVKLACAPYVAFLDSDDRWTEEKLKKQLALLNRTGGVLCSTAREFATHQGELTGIIVPVKPIITYRSLLYDNSINCSSVLMRTEIAREFPMLHDELHEDYITWLKILKKYKKAYAINEPLLKYRCSQGGKSSNKLKSAWMHYHSLRFVGIPPLSAFWHFLFYMVSGILKYRKVKRKR